MDNFKMTFENFKSSLDKKNPPENLNQLLLALWYDAKGDWEKSHKLVSDINSKEASLIHAYLHRKEGDLGNAEYWYRRAATDCKNISLKEEWDFLVKNLCSATYG